MTRLFAFLLLCAAPILSYAQNDTTYLDADMRQTTWSFATCYQVMSPINDSLYAVSLYYINNKLEYKGHSIRSKKEEYSVGRFDYYDKAGNVIKIEHYNRGKADSIWVEYYDSSTAIHSITYYGTNGRIDSLNSFYPSGRLKRREYHSPGEFWGQLEQISGLCFNQDGSSRQFTPYIIMPQSPVDVSRFLSQHIHYPLSAREQGVQGKVMLHFRIDENGDIHHIVVIRGVRDDLNNEAVRVLKLFPRWKPG